MKDRGVGEAIAGLLAVELAGCDRAGLGAAVTLAQRVRGRVDAVDVAIARRSRELAAEGHSSADIDVLRLAVDVAVLEARDAGCDVDDLVGPKRRPTVTSYGSVVDRIVQRFDHAATGTF